MTFAASTRQLDNIIKTGMLEERADDREWQQRISRSRELKQISAINAAALLGSDPNGCWIDSLLSHSAEMEEGNGILWKREHSKSSPRRSGGLVLANRSSRPRTARRLLMRDRADELLSLSRNRLESPQWTARGQRDLTQSCHRVLHRGLVRQSIR